LSCLARTALLVSSRNPAELEVQRCTAIQDIQSLFAQAQAQNKKVAQEIKVRTCGAVSYRYISADTRIFELDIDEITLNYPGISPGTRGLYDRETCKIILCRGNWCRETLIHEALHSVSFYPLLGNLGRRYLNFFEGLTEFFAGYIMFCKYLDCHKKWAEQQFQECTVTYIQNVKLWASFCRFIRIQELLPIYFWDGTTNWNLKCNEFLARIHQAGYAKFEDFRNRPIPTLEARLLDECLKNFNRIQFRNIYESPLVELLDFTHILH